MMKRLLLILCKFDLLVLLSVPFCVFFLLYGSPCDSSSISSVNLVNPIVSVTQGQIKGRIGTSRQDKKYFEFLGIPYARPPKRFRPPEPPEDWEGVRDATFYRDSCIQAKPNSGNSNGTLGSENCLFLNIYVFKSNVNSPSKQLLPVLVFINDDNFQTSTPPDFYGPQYFMDEPVILVQISYRIGVFGFLTTGKANGILPGNLGLKDQVCALRWLQNNLHVFGGDRFRVTLFGSGSGSVSVSLHLLSSMSSGLFTNGISQGGTILCPNSLVLDPASFATELGTFLKCPVNFTDAQLEACLMDKDAADIIQFQKEMTGWANGKLVMPLGPSIEFIDNETIVINEEENLFLSDYPENILKSGTFNKLPWIVGCNSKAGFSPNVAVFKRNSSHLEALNKNWDKFAPLIFDYGLTSRSPFFISRKVREFYFSGTGEEQIIGHNNVDQLYDAISDHNYFQCTRKSAMLHGKFASVFLYYFTYERANFMRMSEINGVGLSGELQYLFKLNPKSNNSKMDSSPQIMRRSQSFKFSTSLIHLWASFALHGFPTETWPQREAWQPLSKSQVLGQSPLKWYHIDTETRSISEPFFPHLLEFWQKLDTNFKLKSLMKQHSIKLNERRQRQRKRRLNLQFRGGGLSSSALASGGGGGGGDQLFSSIIHQPLMIIFVLLFIVLYC